MAKSKSRNLAQLVKTRGTTLELNSNNISAHFQDIDFTGTGSITLPSGTTAQRDSSPDIGAIRFNTTLGKFEGYKNGAWAEIGGGSSDTWTTDQFTGNGSTAAYTLTQAPNSEDNVIAFIEGVFQNPGDYVVSGTTITFDDNVPSGQKVIVHSVKATVSGNNLNQDLFAGDGSTTDFTLSIAPINENNTMVYIDGVYQNKSTYSTSGTTIAFSTAPPNTSAVEVLCFTQTSINTPTSNSVNTIHMIDDSITSAKLGHGLTLQGNTVINASLQVEDISIPDNYALRLGNGQDLRLYHNGTNSYIDDVGTGALNIRSSGIYLEKADGSEVMGSFLADGAATLYHNGIAKIATTATGITANGTLVATTANATTINATTVNATTFNGQLDGTVTATTSATTQANSVSNTTIATTAFVSNKVTELIGGAPGTLDTLNELAAAINDDSNYNSTLTTALATKLPLAGGTLTGTLTVDAGSSGMIDFGDVTTAYGRLYADNSGTFIGSKSNHPLILRSNHTTALTLDTLQNATFAGNIDVTGTITGDDSLSIHGGTGNAYLQVGSDTGLWTWKNYRSTHKLALEDSDGTGEVLGIDTSGNFSFGAMNTTRKLGVKSNSRNSTQIALEDASTTNEVLRIGQQSDGDSFLQLRTVAGAGPVLFDASGISYVAGGNFGVGHSNPAVTLDVKSNHASDYIAIFKQLNASNLGTVLIDTPADNNGRTSRLDFARGGQLHWKTGMVYGDITDGYGLAYNDGTGTALDNTRLLLTNDGKLGLGEVSPQHRLDIGGMADPTVRIKSLAGGDPTLIFDAAATNRSARIKFYDNGSVVGGFIDYLHQYDKMNFGSGSSATPTMTVADQAVGIGTDSPTTKLQVEGTVLAENAKLKAIAKERAGTTAVDIFVYDTRKDSDGGAWRKRTKNTSWYNEPLNTSTRGARKEFPVTAVIVCELARVLILDGDDPDLPTWMIFNGLNGGSSYTWHGSGYSGESNRCVAMLNGTLAIGVRGSVSSVSGLSTVNFIEEVFHKYGGAAGSRKRDISQRNNAFSVRNDTTGNHGAAGKDIYDVAMTVEKGADIDPGTGLPKVTIAIATNGGLSIVKKSGANNTEIIHITAGAGSSYNGVGHVDITDENWLMFEQDNSSTPRSEFFIPIPDGNRTTQTSDGAITDKVVMKFYNTATHKYPYFKGLGIVNAKPMKGQAHALKGSSGELTLVDPNPYDKEHSSVCYIGADHNTGWLTGGTKLAALNSTTSGTVVDTDILGGIGDFTDANAWTVPTGWSLSSNIATGAAVTNYLLPATNGLLVPGEQYRITISQPAYTSGALYLYMGTGAPGTGNHYINLPSTGGTFTYTLVAYNSNFGLYGANYTGQIDNVTIVKCDPDRSAWTAGVEAIGTVNKTAVATGAELMAYGPFTTSNYLQQPYNSQLQVGTGAVTYSAWCYKSGGVIGYLFDRANGNGTSRFGVYFASSTTIDTYTPGGALNGITIPDNEWFNYTAVKGSGKIIVYINGERKGSVASAENLTVDPADNIPLKIGVRYNSSNPATDLKIALFKVTATAVSHSQVRKNYEDEKHLFSENAKATIGGTDDSITGFGYDSDTELLHVGSSWGRSSFDGLTRAEYSTDVVTTAIDASNGLVAEE